MYPRFNKQRRWYKSSNVGQIFTYNFDRLKYADLNKPREQLFTNLVVSWITIKTRLLPLERNFSHTLQVEISKTRMLKLRKNFSFPCLTNCVCLKILLHYAILGSFGATSGSMKRQDSQLSIGHQLVLRVGKFSKKAATCRCLSSTM